MTEDQITELAIQRHQELALLRHQQLNALSDAESAEFCESCGNAIPETRRKAIVGVTVCVECKRLEELSERLLR
jgi:phage/conjugal plasmid C-4 type zinc finger TraR family protein